MDGARGGGTDGPHVVFFDGVCGLCSRFVQVVLPRDRRGRFLFAPLQGELARRELPPRGGDPERLDTIYVLTSDGRLLARSRAVIFVAARLAGPWRLCGLLRIVPVPIADAVYALVARTRYRLFGRQEACMVPTPGQRARFLDEPPPNPSPRPNPAIDRDAT